MRRYLLAAACTAVLVVTAIWGRSGAAAQATPADYDLPGGNGHFYTQTNAGAGPQYGYRITNDGGIAFWSEFQRLGGVPALGYPVSRRFTLDGFTVQATQKVILQWRPETQHVDFVNVFDELHAKGDDSVLQQTYSIPPQVSATFDTGKTTYQQIVTGRLALLDTDPAIDARYVGGQPVDVAILYNGLPTSPVTDMGPFYAIRNQRDAFQRWKVDSPSAGIKAGDVTEVNGGDIAKKLGLVPLEATYTETSNGVVNGPTATPTPAATATPTPAPKPAYPFMAKDVTTPPMSCGPYPQYRVTCTASDPNAGVQFIQGHVMDQSGNGLGGVLTRAQDNYGLVENGNTEGDGLFTINIDNNCQHEGVIWNVWLVDSNGNQISDVRTINYTNCNVAGSFHFDFIKTS